MSSSKGRNHDFSTNRIEILARLIKFVFCDWSLSRDRRKRELMRISKENMRMMRRISAKKSSLSVDKMERDWRKNLRYMDNISAFPEDWYLIKDTGRQLNTSRSNPNLANSQRSAKTTNRRDEDEKEEEAAEAATSGQQKSARDENTDKNDKKVKEANEKKESPRAEEKSEKTSPRKKETSVKEPVPAAENEKKYEDDFD